MSTWRVRKTAQENSEQGRETKELEGVKWTPGFKFALELRKPTDLFSYQIPEKRKIRLIFYREEKRVLKLRHIIWYKAVHSEINNV